jgi:hypothetical protein
MHKGSVQKGNDADTATSGDDIDANQQPQTGEINRGSTGDAGYYYQQQFAPIPYGYHMTEQQWATHEHVMQQGYQQHYHPSYG